MLQLSKYILFNLTFRFENLQHALCHALNRGVCWAFIQVEVADKEKYLRYCLTIMSVLVVRRLCLAPISFWYRKV